MDRKVVEICSAEKRVYCKIPPTFGQVRPELGDLPGDDD